MSGSTQIAFDSLPSQKALCMVRVSDRIFQRFLIHWLVKFYQLSVVLLFSYTLMISSKAVNFIVNLIKLSFLGIHFSVGIQVNQMKIDITVIYCKALIIEPYKQLT